MAPVETPIQSSGNWTLEQTRKAIVDGLELMGESLISLDVSKADPTNIRDMFAWISSMGYTAEEHPNSGVILVMREVIK